jgi:hypothetical protein
MLYIPVYNSHFLPKMTNKIGLHVSTYINANMNVVVHKGLNFASYFSKVSDIMASMRYSKT